MTQGTSDQRCAARSAGAEPLARVAGSEVDLFGDHVFAAWSLPVDGDPTSALSAEQRRHSKTLIVIDRQREPAGAFEAIDRCARRLVGAASEPSRDRSLGARRTLCRGSGRAHGGRADQRDRNNSWQCRSPPRVCTQKHHPSSWLTFLWYPFRSRCPRTKPDVQETLVVGLPGVAELSYGSQRTRVRAFGYGRPMPRREYRDRVATFLWEWGEDGLSEKALSTTHDDMALIELIADLRWEEVDDKATRGKMQRSKAVALAAVDVLEGKSRNLTRRRARYSRQTLLPPPLKQQIEAERERSLREGERKTKHDGIAGHSVFRRRDPRPLAPLESRLFDELSPWLEHEYGFAPRKAERRWLLRATDAELRLHLGSSPACTSDAISVAPSIRLRLAAPETWSGDLSRLWGPEGPTYGGNLYPWLTDPDFQSAGGPLVLEGDFLRNGLLSASRKARHVAWYCRDDESVLVVSDELQRLLRTALSDVLPPKSTV